jgi:hypothetical protein
MRLGFRARWVVIALVLSAACRDNPGADRKLGELVQSSGGEILPILCPPNALHQLRAPDAGSDAPGEPASNFDTCSWAGWSPQTFAAEDGEFFVVNGQALNGASAGELQRTTEVAQSVHPWAQNATPGTVGVILKLARNTPSEFSTNTLLVDLVGPLGYKAIPNNPTLPWDAGFNAEYTFFSPISSPLTLVGQSIVDDGTETSAPLLATGRLDTSTLQVGVDTTVDIPLSPNRPRCTMADTVDGGANPCNAALGSRCDPATCTAKGNCLCTSPLINYADAGAGQDAGLVYNEYALVFHMEGPANDILIAGNDGTPSLAGQPTYVLICPEPGVQVCEGAPDGIYTLDAGFGGTIGTPLGFVFLRQELYAPVFNPVTMTVEQDLIDSSWVANANVAMNFYMTVNDSTAAGFDAGLP